MTIHSTLVAAAMGCTLLTASTLSAQDTTTVAKSQPKSRWELRVPSGTLIPTGAQRDFIKRGNLTATQLTYVAPSGLAITSTVGWARSRDAATTDNPKLDVFTYDVGAELRAPHSITGEAVTFIPFTGVGAGGRSYNYRNLDVGATHNAAAYGSVGGELGFARVRVRLEARDYVTGFKPLSGAGLARTGNDVVVMVGVRLVSR